MRFAAAAALLWAATAAADWTHLENEQFEVDLPGEATVSADTTDTAQGKVTNTLHQVMVGKAMYALSYADYPADFEKRAVPAKALEGARDGALANLHGTLLTDVPVFLDSGTPKKKWPGRDFTASTPQGVSYAARVVLIGSRLYQLVAVAEGSFDEATFERIKASFKPRKNERGSPRQLR